MRAGEKLRKPVTEAKYLTVENADRYRCIIRLFYLQYEKLKYWLYQEEVYEEMAEDTYFSDYTQEQCQQDLAALVGWGNLLTIQDTKAVSTIEEFKNKKFRYQLSEYTVEIERMVVRLENLSVEGSSLEPSLLERIRVNLSKLEKMVQEDDEALYSWWNDLNSDFVRLNQNYQDYMRELNSVKAEEMMKTREFLIFKDRLIDYLRSFVKSLQINVTVIEQILDSIEKQTLDRIFQRITTYENSIPHMDTEISEDMIYEKIQGRWSSIYNWFSGERGRDSEALKVFDTTNEIIRKITRYAARISEMSSGGANRREEYYRIAHLFSRCGSIGEAHKLSSYVFGIEKPLHLKGDLRRSTESINSGVLEEEPHEISVTPRTRNYHEKGHRQGIADRRKEKDAMLRETMKRMEDEAKLIQSYIKGDYLDFSTLPVIEPQVRDVFLSWLSRALESENRRAKTEDGRDFHLEEEEGETCTVICTDGTFRMPKYTIVFDNGQSRSSI